MISTAVRPECFSLVMERISPFLVAIKMCFRIWKFPPGTILAEKPLTFVSIETLTECVVFMISREDFEIWIAQDIHLLRLVVHKIAYKLYHSSHNRDARLFYPPTFLFLYYMLKFAPAHNIEKKGEIILQKTREGIREELGMTVKTINRTIAKLKEDGLIDSRKGKVVMSQEQYQMARPRSGITYRDVRKRMKKEIFEISGITCLAYEEKKPEYLIIQPINEPHAQMLAQQVSFMINNTEKGFLLIAFLVKNWNHDLSPWSAPAVFGKESFGDSAEKTWSFIKEELIPEAVKRYKLENDGSRKPVLSVILGGYSLAGLFSLWSAYRQDISISAAAAMSPSVWFPGWLEYMKDKKIQVKNVYLSLGDREEKTRNEMMSRVGDCIRKMDEWYRKNEKIESVLEWNQGNHFQDVDVRCGKGFVWCMENLKCKS